MFKDVLECQNTDDVYTFLKAKKEKELNNKKDQLAKLDKKGEKSEVKGAKIISKELPLPKFINENESKQFKPKQKKSVTRTIQIKDFVVRRSVFICMHKEHVLHNIDAVIRLVTNKGEITDTTVSAGYCQDCDTYFIMESTYLMLKNKGTPLCRVSDEKTYLKGSAYVNGMKLASESLLMQYGYNVSQQEGLTETRRHKILAVIIDNKILTKSEIISYLDFFINQRQGKPMYEVAIQKWSTDRDFVAEYRSGSYTRVGISGIMR